MVDQVKVLIVERNGAELADSEELTLSASNVPLSSAKYSSTDIKSALDEVWDRAAPRFYFQFVWVGQMNFDQYLVSHVTPSQNIIRSGDASNGFQFNNASPIVAPFSGTIKSSVFRNRGVAQSTGSPAVNMTLRYELWRVGITGEGTKLGDVNATFTSTGKTIGNYWNSAVNTDLNIASTENISVTQGDLLGLKFKSTTGNSNVVSVHNAIVGLELVAP